MVDKGPHFAIDNLASAELAKSILPNRSAKQIRSVAHTSLMVNPFLSVSDWTDEEKMTLCLARKVFDTDDESINNLMFQRIASQIVHRSKPQVKGKWDLSLDPHILRRDFTKEENELLVQLTSQKGFDAIRNWGEVAKYFPHRNPRHLRYHWYNISSVKMYMNNKESAFKKQKQISINCLNHFKIFMDTMDIGIPELEKAIAELRLFANMNRLMFNMGWELRNMIEKEEY